MMQVRLAEERGGKRSITQRSLRNAVEGEAGNFTLIYREALRHPYGRFIQVVRNAPKLNKTQPYDDLRQPIGYLLQIQTS